ncbi:MAG TPA: cytochrome c biogenesis protein ResB, partial [Phycisphaerae bacterium]|nr:cytochrome c biogenesis protein ResB [Phycisphaerae bacterium]
MNRLRRILQWASLGAIAALLCLCAVGAFLGSARATALFNSLPLAAGWVLLAAMFAAGVVAFRSFRRSPSMLAIHLGCLLVICGGLWGSRDAHRLRQSPRRGQMAMLEGSSSAALLTDAPEPVRLPFSVRLVRCWREYYPSAETRWTFFSVQADPDAEEGYRAAEFDAPDGREVPLPGTDARVQVLQYVLPPGGALDAHGRAAPPTVKLRLARGERWTVKLLVAHDECPYEQLELTDLYDDEVDWLRAGAPVLVFQRPEQQVRDYKSDLAVLRDGHEVARKTIEVNDPLHYDGYHFYLAELGQAHGRPYAVLNVVSDAGLPAVLAGF